MIAAGFLNNCAIYPWVESKEVPWTYLIISFGIMVGWGGFRDVILRKFIHLGPILENATAAKGKLSNKVWIPAIGWFLVLGYINNCILYIYDITPREIDWLGLIATLAVMFTASGARDYGIYHQEKKYNPDVKVPTPEQKEANLPADF
ncbi:MAG: hypothetical protein IJ824_06025 [Alphaproteobacteria bacterium]|nr:hypothetical protein [Alphaproteobacteria bacterium]